MPSEINNTVMGFGVSKSPKYMQVKGTLLQRIRERTFRPGNTLPSEQSLATEFGVSSITIKRALNDLAKEGILERRQGVGTFVAEDKREAATKNTVKEEAVPQPLPRYSVLFLACGQSSELYTRFLSGVERQLSAHEHPLLYSSITSYKEADRERISRLIQYNAVCTLLISGWVDDKAVRFVKRLGPPVVVIGNYPITETVSQISSDIRGAAHRAVDLFLTAGVRRVGLLNGARRYGVAVELATGFDEAATEMADRVDLAKVEWDDAPSRGYDHAAKLIDELGTPAGILAEGELAGHVLRVCGERGLAIGRDVRLIGMESSPMHYDADKTLTRFRVNWEQQFPTAVYDVLTHLVDKALPYTIKCVLPENLIPGDSCESASGEETRSRKRGNGS